MTEIINKFTKEFEESGYAVAKSSFDGWLSSKKDITQKDEATVKLFMARLCLAQEKFDDLQSFFNTGMSQAEKEEMESLKSKVQELEKVIVQKDYELDSLRKEKVKEQRIDTNINSQQFKTVGNFLMFKDYWRGPYRYSNIGSMMDSYPEVPGYKKWRLLGVEEYESISKIVSRKKNMAFQGLCIFGGRYISSENMELYKDVALMICPVCEKV